MRFCAYSTRRVLIYRSVLVFMSATGRGLKVEYPSITLHAISRSESGPSIYCQLDESLAAENAAQNDDDVTEMREMIIVPKAAESRTYTSAQ